MPPAGFEPSISAGERPRTYALDRAATGTGIMCCSIVMLQKKAPHLNALTKYQYVILFMLICIPCFVVILLFLYRLDSKISL